MMDTKKVTLVLEKQQVTEIVEMKELLLRKVPKGYSISQTEIVKQAIDHYYIFLKREAGAKEDDWDGISFGEKI